MKKINVSTVKQMADIEVIFMNTTFVAKVMKAAAASDAIMEKKYMTFGEVTEDDLVINNFFNEMLIAFGVKEEPKEEPKKDENANPESKECAI